MRTVTELSGNGDYCYSTKSVTYPESDIFVVHGT